MPYRVRITLVFNDRKPADAIINAALDQLLEIVTPGTVAPDLYAPMISLEQSDETDRIFPFWRLVKGYPIPR